MSTSRSNQPEAFPLQKVDPQYDFKVSDPFGKIPGLWKEQPSNGQHIHATATSNPVITSVPGVTPMHATQRTLSGDSAMSGGDSRKRNWAAGGTEEESISSCTESCDDMMASDTDTNSMVSNQGSMLAYLRENKHVHPPKRRLMAPSPNSSTVLTPSNISTASSTSQMATPGATTGESIHQPLLGSEIRTPTAFNSSTNTPMSEMDEEDYVIVEGVVEHTQQSLPLPSPSASPVSGHTNKEDDEEEEARNILTLLQHSRGPTNQKELLGMIYGLSSYLSEPNHSHLIFKLLQNVNRSTLSSFNDVIHNSLRRDLISNLPLEITYNILKHLDYKTICSISRVCSNWNRIVNATGIWSDLLKRDKLVSGDAEIEYELKQPDLLQWSTANPKSMSLSPRVNLAQLLFKKRRIILNRWMDPKYEPKRISVPGHGSNVVTCLQHDDDKIITGVDDKLINIYSTKTGELLRVLKGHDGGVWALKYTGNTLVSGSTDRTVRVWNIKTGKCTQVFRGHTSTVRCLDILHPVKIGTDDNGDDIIFPESPLLVTGSRDHDLRVWKLPLVSEDDSDISDNTTPVPTEAGAENPYLVAILSGHTHSVRSVSGYGNIILSGSYDTTVRVWDLLDNGRCKHVLSGHQDKIYSTALDFQNKRCFSGSMDATINVWDFEKGKLLHTLEGHGSLVGLLELSKEYLVSAAADATLRVWNPESGRNLSKLEGHTAAITCFQHDNLRIVSGSEKMLKLWDIKSGKFVRDLLADITGGIWQVRFDFCRCVAAVQRSKNDVDETFIEIVDFSTPPS
ncbi:cell division control protein 4 [[Candida] anglica]|uniref:Cell division control protein 4 n=1 Tax=[Candida] anglica TaxID=148631 RepID=A0ABP0ELC5_9ASCO